MGSWELLVARGALQKELYYEGESASWKEKSALQLFAQTFWVCKFSKTMSPAWGFVAQRGT